MADHDAPSLRHDNIPAAPHQLTTGLHSATPTIPQSAAEQIARVRAYYAYPIQLDGKHHQPGARQNLTEQAREWRTHEDVQHALGTLAASA